MVADLLSPNRCHWKVAKVKNYNLNVTEFRYPAFPMLFFRNRQFHLSRIYAKVELKTQNSIIFLGKFIQIRLEPGDFVTVCLRVNDCMSLEKNQK